LLSRPSELYDFQHPRPTSGLLHAIISRTATRLNLLRDALFSIFPSMYYVWVPFEGFLQRWSVLSLRSVFTVRENERAFVAGIFEAVDFPKGFGAKLIGNDVETLRNFAPNAKKPWRAIRRFEEE
jgi:hypothetical protein